MNHESDVVFTLVIGNRQRHERIRMKSCMARIREVYAAVVDQEQSGSDTRVFTTKAVFCCSMPC